MPRHKQSGTKDAEHRMHERRLLGKAYTNRVFAETRHRCGQHFTMKDLHVTALSMGNAKLSGQEEDPNIHRKAITSRFSLIPDHLALATLSPDHAQLIDTLPEHYVLDALHMWIHIGTDKRQNIEDEFSLVAAQSGMLNGMDQQEYAFRYYLLNYPEFAKAFTNPKIQSITRDAQNLHPNYAPDGRDPFGNLLCVEDVVERVLPSLASYLAVAQKNPTSGRNLLDPRSKAGEYSMTPTHYLDSVARGALLKHKIERASPHGHDVFINHHQALEAMPGTTIYTEDCERELALRIAQDKPIPKSRLPFSAHQISQTKDVAAGIRDQMASYR